MGKENRPKFPSNEGENNGKSSLTNYDDQRNEISTATETADDENSPMSENKTITITSNGEENFGTITFTKTGTYSYKVTELARDLDYYDKVYEKMKLYYDGYRFSEYTEETVFNSTLVMYYLKEYLELGKEPEKKLDINIVANFEKLGSLITLKNNPYSKEILECLIQNKELKGTITDKFNLNMELTQDDIISILFYFGYSSIKDSQLGLVEFKVPNYIMKEVYNDYFMYLLRQAGVNIDITKIRELIIELALEGKIDKLCKLVEDYLSYIGNIARQRYDEKYVKGYMHSILLTTPVFNTYLGYNVKHNRYIDVAIFKNEEMGAKYQAIIEVKYIKKQETENQKVKEEIIAEKRREALDQIKEYMLDDRLPKDNMKKFIVIYVGESLELLEEVV